MTKSPLSEVNLSSAVMEFAINHRLNYSIKRLSCSPILSCSTPLNNCSALEVSLTDFEKGSEVVYFLGNLNNKTLINNALYFQSKKSKESKELFSLLEKIGYSVLKLKK